MRVRLALLGVFAGLTTIGGAAWAAAQGTTVAAAQDASPVDVTVEMRDFAFAPRNIVVRQNQPVRFLVANVGAERHRMNIAGQGETWRSEDPQGGESTSFTATFSQAGTYQVWCSVTPHREEGMVGTLTVVPADDDPTLVTKVELSEWAVQPLSAAMVASPNARFEIHNAGRFGHNLTIEGHGLKVASETIDGGDTVAWDTSLLTPGTYEIYCSVVVGAFDHRDLGMTGTLQVLDNPGIQ